jgi:hypothetical protein
MGAAEADTGQTKPPPNSTNAPINKHMVPVNLRDSVLSMEHLLMDSHSAE